jgi:hypothetical protein
MSRRLKKALTSRKRENNEEKPLVDVKHCSECKKRCDFMQYGFCPDCWYLLFVSSFVFFFFLVLVFCCRDTWRGSDVPFGLVSFNSSSKPLLD